MNHELGGEFFPVQKVDMAPLGRWANNQHLESIVQGHPELLPGLEKTLKHPVVAAAIERTSGKTEEELAKDLADGLRTAFLALGELAPASIEDLDQRARLPEAKDGSALTGTARDYLKQRLVGTVNIVDLEAMMPLSAELKQTLEQEAEKLAIFLVALERAEQPTDDELAA